MTISSTINENHYIGSDSTDTFSYAYKIFAETDLLVTQKDASNVETTLVLNTGYTVTGVGETAGGTIVLTGGYLTTGFVLSIKRVPPIIQLTDIRNLGDSFPETIENTFDNFIMIAQYLDNNIGRAVSIPETTINFDTELPEPEASKWPRVNAAATGWEWVDAGNFSTLMTTVNGSLTLAAGELSVTNPLLFGVATGTVDVITLSVTPAPASLTNNLRVYFEASGANTSVTPTLNLNGLGAKVIVKGSDFPLRAGDIPGVNAQVDIVFNVSLDKWVYLNPALMEDAGDKAVIQSGGYLYGVGAGAVNVMTTTLNPALLAYTEGMDVVVKVNLANTITTPNLNIDGRGAKTIKHEDGSALAIGDLPLNYNAEFKYDGTDFLFQNPQILPVGISGESRNLIIIPNAGTPTTSLDVDADEIILADANGRAKWVGSVNHTIDATTTGLNALDTGALTLDTWYFIFEISNGTTTGALLSLSSTSPTLPTGYTFKALLGAVLTDGSSQFISFRQEGKRADLDANATIKDGTFTINAWTGQDMTAVFPPIAKQIRVAFGTDNSGAEIGFSPRSDGASGEYIGFSTNTVAVDFGGAMPTVRENWATMGIRYASTSYYHCRDVGCSLIGLGWDL